MASLRRPRRLQNLAPEQDSLGACFICQDEFRIDQLPRLRRTDCCRVLLHSRCLEEMLNRTSICGNCRQDRTPENTRTLPLDEEEPENSLFGPGTIVFMLRLQRIGFGEIDRYRRNGLPNPHRRASPLWNSLPFDIPDFYLLEYLSNIEDFIREEPGETMYLHGFVVLPTPVTTLARHSFYELFLMNIPETVLELVNGIRFRFLFHHDQSQTCVTVTTIHVHSFGESSWYPADSPYYL